MSTVKELTVRELMSPVESIVWSTQSLGEAARVLTDINPAALVLGLSGQPMGLITVKSLAFMAAQSPKGWVKKRCACMLSGDEIIFRPHDPIEAVLWRYRDGVVDPFLVLEEGNAPGILYPAAVFERCLEQGIPIFQELGLPGDAGWDAIKGLRRGSQEGPHRA